MRILLGLLCLPAASAAMAQTSLGITGASAPLGYSQTETGDPELEAALAVITTQITQYHGLQTGLSFVDTPHGGIGTIDAHLYMTPRPGMKYGLFATLADVDGRALRWGTLGAEAMASLTPRTTAAVRTGIGYSDDGLDFVFAGADIAQALTETITLEGSLDIADFDEPGLHAISHQATLRATYRAPGSPFGAYAFVTSSGLDGGQSENRIGIGITFDIGTTGGHTPDARNFRTTDPVAPLIRRGLW